MGSVREPRYVIFAVISSFVLAELGDKTMLATVALASDYNWAGVWIGATVGMVLADGVAIAVGALLHKRLPERFLHLMASVLFLVFGLWLLFDNALGLPWVAVASTGRVAAVGFAARGVPSAPPRSAATAVECAIHRQNPRHGWLPSAERLTSRVRRLRRRETCGKPACRRAATDCSVAELLEQTNGRSFESRDCRGEQGSLSSLTGTEVRAKQPERHYLLRRATCGNHIGSRRTAARWHGRCY